jgi:hypothetical protein
LKTMPVESANKSPGPPREKLRAEMPQIPGVYNGRPAASTAANRANPNRLLQIGGVALAVLLIGVLWWMKSASRGAAEPSSSETATDPAPPPVATATEASASYGPVKAATMEELAKPWSFKQFTFVRPLTHENLDAMVIRLPGGRLWAFALREPYGRCDLEFVTDLAQLAKKYGYRASHPMVASPCANTIYDPMKVGPVGGNVWARGQIVQGAGVRPPISIDVLEKEGSIIADGIE